MHRAAFAALGLPHTYEAVRVSAEEVEAHVAALRAGEYDGLNITLPHKELALRLADATEPLAQSIGAVNTLTRGPDGRVRAFNTDAPALAAELRRLAPEHGARWTGCTVVVLGAGGAARAAVCALAMELEVGRVVVRSRRFARAEVAAAFSSELTARLGGRAEILAAPLVAEPALDRAAQAVIQATSVGMHGGPPEDALGEAVAWGALPSSAVALDLVYAPPETAFLREASRYLLRNTNGYGVLVEQGARALELWLGVLAPRDVMALAVAAS